MPYEKTIHLMMKDQIFNGFVQPGPQGFRAVPMAEKYA